MKLRDLYHRMRVHDSVVVRGPDDGLSHLLVCASRHAHAGDGRAEASVMAACSGFNVYLGRPIDDFEVVRTLTCLWCTLADADRPRGSR